MMDIPRRAARAVRILAFSAFCALPLGGLTACTGSSPEPDQQAAQAYLAAAGLGDAAAAAADTTDVVAAKSAWQASLSGLGTGARAKFTVTGVANRTSNSSTVAYTAAWSLPGSAAPWTYQGTLAMAKADHANHADNANHTWQVEWAPSAVYPTLTAGQHLQSVRTQPARAALLDSSGRPLVSAQPVVTVGIDPAQVTNLTGLAATLASVLQVSAADVVSSVKAAPPGQFVPVITLRQGAYEQVRGKIHDLPGTEFQTGSELLGPTSRFAQPLLGQVGPATQQLISASNGAVQAGDTTGLSGLQKALNAQLAGTAGLSIAAASDSTGVTIATLATIRAPKPGTPVQLTLDRATQTAAEAALANVTLPASIVVTQPSTGKILAVADTAATDGDIALEGQFPPGSTFKIVTYAAAFSTDPALTPATPAACPSTITVNGQTIRNENNFAKGTIPLSSAFAFSCNTTAANLGLKLPGGALLTAAKSLGLGQQWSLPVAAFSGSLPQPSGPSAVNEQAADAYGQGQVLVSPLLMAELAGAAGTGTPIAPSLVAGKQAIPGPVLPKQVTAVLNSLMRDVVTVPGATGRDLADLPGPVEGKTGTAEFGTAVPPQSHSWFAGTRGDLAFSVFIYGGGNSDSAAGAVPVAKALLTQLP
ncbi:MAG TPA: penicillin-binding transpeptidase domain-containing protein [Jatrophihabitantaceae bacterium]|jgi:cell division protein FtsI/penicillin-binding protein 2|nr:penicillin-binding transpeptidase domain-containing protein [Jatrophihabitantaceae bacterium]